MASAAFWTVLDPGHSGVVFESTAGLDQCALTLYDYDDPMSGQDPIYKYQSAGVVNLEGPGGTIAPQPQSGGRMVFYQIGITSGQQLLPETVYDVAASGAQFPSFSASGGIEMPAALHLASPSPTQSFRADGALSVPWSGGDNEPVWLVLTSASATLDYGYLLCQVDNDGAFTLPANLVGQLPSGGAQLIISQ